MTDSQPSRSRDAPFQARIYEIVRSIPFGKIASYGGVAAIVGKPRAARGVGRALCALPTDTDVPWWRVVNRNGEISVRGAMHGAIIQRKLLEREGVRFDRRGRIDWESHGWNGDAAGRETLPNSSPSSPERAH